MRDSWGFTGFMNPLERQTQAGKVPNFYDIVAWNEVAGVTDFKQTILRAWAGGFLWLVPGIHVIHEGFTGS